MSLLPAAMQIKDDMPMTLGQAVKRVLTEQTPVDAIRAFNDGDYSLTFSQRNGHSPLPPAKFEAAMVVFKLYDYAFGGAKTYKREPTLAEMPEALREQVALMSVAVVAYESKPALEAIRADEPKPKFKVGDKVRVLCDEGDPPATLLRCRNADEDFAGEWDIRLDGGPYRGLSGIAAEHEIELLPSPKQEGEQ